MSRTGMLCTWCLGGDISCPNCEGAGYVMQCDTCDGKGVAYTMNETEIGCAPGSSEFPCPDCTYRE